ncbi:unnamed protein product [Rhizoctonia solani]|uniref:RZ-type domain-containing protein n=1 Tax=Rhizoctonia solani TaxID=456999 RepID=A0A8H3DNH7_9AGAM|nr:unnamed protein product [Rhizoctonia solani]CAE6529095.1 unnamed protein product [Rhizoctonia solani]
MVAVVSLARRPVSHVYGLALGTARIYNVHVFAGWRASAFLATGSVKMLWNVDILARRFAVNLVLDKPAGYLEDKDTPDSMTITLPCRHVFTVETLDAITHLGSFYEKDTNGKWAKAIIQEHAVAIHTCPVCPSCHGQIDSLRYGRVVKNSNLALLQHNIALHLSHRLVEAENVLAAIRAGLEKKVVDAIKGCNSENSEQPITPPALPDTEDRRDIALTRDVDLPTPVEVIDDIYRFHAFPQSYANIWQREVKAALDLYRVARQITCQRDPVIHVYEASLSRLYREALGSFATNASLTTPRDVEQQALHLARMQIGQLPPRSRVNHQCVVEAFWVTIDILLQLGIATSKASDEVRHCTSNAMKHQQWDKLAEFILERAAKDAKTVYQLAIKSESWDKAIKCQVSVLQTHYELAAHQCWAANGKGTLLSEEAKAKLVDMCHRAILHVKQLRISVPQEYLKRWAPSDQQNKLAWADANFVQPVGYILKSWQSLEQSWQLPGQSRQPQARPANGETWIQGISKEERSMILQALTQAAGRSIFSPIQFYQCPNLHPYVVGESGSPTQSGICPECGAQIGGRGYILAPGNSYIKDFIAFTQ